MKRRGVRLSGGLFRGRFVSVPASARPTAGRVREALAEIWSPWIEGARVLDLFAGSGAVGLELTSRGASEAVLLESDREAVRALNRTICSLGVDRVSVIRTRLPEGLRRSLMGHESFDLVFADPPYAFREYELLLERVGPFMASSARLAVEHAARADVRFSSDSTLQFLETRKYGDHALSLFERKMAPVTTRPKSRE